MVSFVKEVEVVEWLYLCVNVCNNNKLCILLAVRSVLFVVW